jgi:hypothetical protein
MKHTLGIWMIPTGIEETERCPGEQGRTIKSCFLVHQQDGVFFRMFAVNNIVSLVEGDPNSKSYEQQNAWLALGDGSDSSTHHCTPFTAAEVAHVLFSQSGIEKDDEK